MENTSLVFKYIMYIAYYVVYTLPWEHRHGQWLVTRPTTA